MFHCAPSNQKSYFIFTKYLKSSEIELGLIIKTNLMRQTFVKKRSLIRTYNNYIYDPIRASSRGLAA